MSGSKTPDPKPVYVGSDVGASQDITCVCLCGVDDSGRLIVTDLAWGKDAERILQEQARAAPAQRP